jgi:hypothetical protein
VAAAGGRELHDVPTKGTVAEAPLRVEISIFANLKDHPGKPHDGAAHLGDKKSARDGHTAIANVTTLIYILYINK